MNVAREFVQLIKNFCAGLEIIQGHNDGHSPVVIEDGNLIWTSTEFATGESDFRELEKLGWEYSESRDGPQFGNWSFRLEIPTTAPCADRLKTEAEIESLFAQF